MSKKAKSPREEWLDRIGFDPSRERRNLVSIESALSQGYHNQRIEEFQEQQGDYVLSVYKGIEQGAFEEGREKGSKDAKKELMKIADKNLQHEHRNAAVKGYLSKNYLVLPKSDEIFSFNDVQKAIDGHEPVNMQGGLQTPMNQKQKSLLDSSLAKFDKNASYIDIMNDGLKLLDAEISELEEKRINLEERLPPDHPKMKQLVSEITKLEEEYRFDHEALTVYEKRVNSASSSKPVDLPKTSRKMLFRKLMTHGIEDKNHNAAAIVITPEMTIVNRKKFTKLLKNGTDDTKIEDYINTADFSMKGPKTLKELIGIEGVKGVKQSMAAYSTHVPTETVSGALYKLAMSPATSEHSKGKILRELEKYYTPIPQAFPTLLPPPPPSPKAPPPPSPKAKTPGTPSSPEFGTPISPTSVPLPDTPESPFVPAESSSASSSPLPDRSAQISDVFQSKLHFKSPPSSLSKKQTEKRVLMLKELPMAALMDQLPIKTYSHIMKKYPDITQPELVKAIAMNTQVMDNDDIEALMLSTPTSPTTQTTPTTHSRKKKSKHSPYKINTRSKTNKL